MNLAYYISSPESMESETPFNLTIMEQSPISGIKAQASPRVLSTHLYFDRLPTNFLTNRWKIILVLRNPKDVVVSFFHMDQKMKAKNKEPYVTWDAYVTCFLNGIGKYGYGNK